MNITVFLGSRMGRDPKYAQLAEKLGVFIAGNGHTLVYGGANNGLMGILADSALAHGGKVTGIITEQLMGREIGHPGLTELTVTKTMAERKDLLIANGDVYIAMPGGIGTLEEAADVISTIRLCGDRKKMIFLNTDGYYEPLRAMLKKMCEEGFVTEKEIMGCLFVSDIKELAEILKQGNQKGQ